MRVLGKVSRSLLIPQFLRSLVCVLFKGWSSEFVPLLWSSLGLILLQSTHFLWQSELLKFWRCLGTINHKFMQAAPLQTTTFFRHPWPFIIIPSIITICLSMGIILNFRIVRGVNYLYAPLNATWKTEEAVFGENWAKDDEHFYPGQETI